MHRLKEGYALIPNPRDENRLRRVELSPDKVDCIVFWTKNPASMLDKLKTIKAMGYHYYFEFTVTAYGSATERNLPPQKTIIETFRKLSERLGPEQVDWRFDPIMVNDQYPLEWQLDRFDKLCRQLHSHTQRCIISFINSYANIGTELHEMKREEMLAVAAGLSQIAAQYHLPLFTCAEEIDLSCYGIGHSSCIDQSKIEQIIGWPITVKKDLGQRKSCGCIESVDIGVYDTCANGCTYCYATTSAKTVRRRMEAHDPNSPILTGYPKGTESITVRRSMSQKILQISLFDR